MIFQRSIKSDISYGADFAVFLLFHVQAKCRTQTDATHMLDSDKKQQQQQLD